VKFLAFGYLHFLLCRDQPINDYILAVPLNLLSFSTAQALVRASHIIGLTPLPEKVNLLIAEESGLATINSSLVSCSDYHSHPSSHSHRRPIR
jgi:hypothetical protein